MPMIHTRAMSLPHLGGSRDHRKPSGLVTLSLVLEHAELFVTEECLGKLNSMHACTQEHATLSEVGNKSN